MLEGAPERGRDGVRGGIAVGRTGEDAQVPAWPTDEIAICAAANLTEAGDYGRRWIVADSTHVWVLGSPGRWPENWPPLGDHPGMHRPIWDGEHLMLAEPPQVLGARAAGTDRRAVGGGAVGPGSVVVVSSLRRCEIRSVHVDEFLGGAAVIADTGTGGVELVRFTQDLLPEFGVVGRVLSAWCAETVAQVDPREVPSYCPQCGRRLQGAMQSCGSCGMNNWSMEGGHRRAAAERATAPEIRPDGLGTKAEGA